jgi:NAD(P)-dependent dehydrogenase (short-subunit alcohol dehydrogenase family)
MNKIALITGAGRGIGAATALRLAQAGYAIALNYRVDQAAAEQTAERVRALGVRALVVQADISQEAEVDRLFLAVDRALGPLTLLVNNAAILHAQSRLVDMNMARWQAVFQTNVIGTFLCSKQAVLRMSRSSGGQGGVIINISSAAARLGSAGEYIDYAASKGAIDTLTIGLASEVADEGIRVNGVRPGLIYTDMHASGGEPGRVDRLKANLPLKRGGTADEVAAAIAFLASDDAAYSTGAFIDVSGGC